MYLTADDDYLFDSVKLHVPHIDIVTVVITSQVQVRERFQH